MYEYTMSENRHDLLAGLARGLPENFYLAGGTALALQLGHRWSEDLDFFLEDFQVYREIKVAGIRDIALMKIIALVQRGTKRDFIDLYFIEKEAIKIEELINLFSQKFRITSYQPMLVYKSLGYFEDADREVTPKMFKEVSWEEIKSYFLRRQVELLESKLK